MQIASTSNYKNTVLNKNKIIFNENNNEFISLLQNLYRGKRIYRFIYVEKLRII